LVLEAGARPEGKLLFVFGFFLIFLVALPDWRKALRPMGILLLVAIPTHFATLTNQAGLLLYTSLLRISPEHSNVAPGIENFTGPIRQQLIAEWEVRPDYPNASQRRTIDSAVAAYLKSQNRPHNTMQVEKFCKKLSMEVFLRKMPEIPGLFLHKWKHTATRTSSEDFSSGNLETKRDRAVKNATTLIIRNSRALMGRPLVAKEEVETFFASTGAATRVAWFNKLAEQWNSFFGAIRTPDTMYANDYIERGIPIYMLVAFCGLALLMLRQPRPFPVAWGLAIACLFFVVLLTANVRPRFRLFFEPYWFLGCAAVLDVLAGWLGRFKRI